MPARLTPQGLLVFRWEPHGKRWETERRTPSLRDLYRRTDLLPGLTISQLFELVEQSAELKYFLGELCWCDIDALHRQPRTPLRDILVYPSYTAMRREEGGNPAEFLLLEKVVTITDPLSDEVTGPPSLAVQHYLLAGRQDADWRHAIAKPGVGHTYGQLDIDICFGAAASLPLRLSASLGWQDIPPLSAPPRRLEASFTLLEILSAIYYALGDPPRLLNAEQPLVELDEFFRQLWPEIHDEEGDDQPPWAKPSG